VTIGAITTSTPTIHQSVVPSVEGLDSHELTGPPTGPETTHTEFTEAKTTPSAPASPPGTTSVPMILSRVFYASEIQSRTTPTNQPTIVKPPMRSRMIAAGSVQLLLAGLIPKR
jgi:hypothetical protein